MFTPMLLESVKEPFDDDNYISEVKFDGIRILLSKDNEKIKLYTRHKNNEVTYKFPELLDLDISNGTTLDGEIIVPGDTGAGDFESVMERFHSNKSDHSIIFCVFDVIRKEGKSLVAAPLSDRKVELLNLSINHPNVVVIEGMKGNGVAYFNLVKEKTYRKG